MSADRCLYAVQLAVPWSSSTEAALGRLAELVRRRRDGLTRSQAGELMGQLTKEMLGLLPFCERAIWDFWGDDPKRSTELFAEWQASLDATDVRTTPLAHGGDYRGTSVGRYGLVTVAMLLAKGAHGTSILAGHCDAVVAPSESAGIYRQALHQVIAPLGGTSPAVVGAMVVFVVPNEKNHALTADDLSGPDYAYLRPVV